MEAPIRKIRILFLVAMFTIAIGAQPAPRSPGELMEMASKVKEAKGPSADSQRSALKKAAQDMGMVEYKSGRYAEALAYLDVAVFIAPDGDTEFIRGLTLLRLSRLDEARLPLQNASLNGTTPTVRESARDYLHRLESGQEQRNVWVNLDVGAGYNSNVGLESSTTATPASSLATQTTLSAGGVWLYSPPINAAVSYLAFWEEPFSEPSGRFLSQTLRASFAYSPGPWSFRLSPSFQYQIYGTSPFLIRYPVSAQVQRSFGAYSAGLQMEMGKSVAQDGNYRYLDGTFHSIRLYGGYRASELNFLGAYTFSKDALGDRTEGIYLLPIRNSSHGPSVRVTWTPTRLWELMGSLSYLMRDFKTLALPGDLKRNDTQISSYVRVSRQITRGLSLYTSLQCLINGSTLRDTSGIEDKNYTQVIGLGGISWDIIN